MLMYSACYRRPWGTSRTDQDDDQDLAQLRRKRESHRERGEQDYSCPSPSQREERGGKIIPGPGPERRGGGSQPADPSDKEVRGETGGGGVTSQEERGGGGAAPEQKRS